MMKKLFLAIFASSLSLCSMAQAGGPQVTYRDGTVEGIDSSGVKIFRGIPFAQSRDHGNNDDPNSGNRDIGKGDPHSGQLRPFVRILS